MFEHQSECTAALHCQFEDARLYCDVLNPEFEKTSNKMYQENKNPFSITTPVFATPVFEAPINLSAFEPSFNSLQNPDDNPF